MPWQNGCWESPPGWPCSRGSGWVDCGCWCTAPGGGVWRTACTRPPVWAWHPFCCWPQGGGRGWRSAFCPGPAAPLEAAVWKVLAGTVFGLIFGAARYKSGRICPSLLLHMAVNTFGS